LCAGRHSIAKREGQAQYEQQQEVEGRHYVEKRVVLEYFYGGKELSEKNKKQEKELAMGR
jgi:hypothetical protein